MRRDLPTGTVTFLFTDIEGSTNLVQHLGDQGFAALLADPARRGVLDEVGSPATTAMAGRHEKTSVSTPVRSRPLMPPSALPPT